MYAINLDAHVFAQCSCEFFGFKFTCVYVCKMCQYINNTSSSIIMDPHYYISLMLSNIEGATFRHSIAVFTVGAASYEVS